MADPETAPLSRQARRYMIALRLHYGCLIALPVLILGAVLLPVGALVFLAMLGGFVACAAVVAITGFYLSDFVCPRCGLAASYRRQGNSCPLSRCMNCGLSAKRAARGGVSS